MEYSNPAVPHDVNVTPAHKEQRVLWYFLYLVASIIVIYIILRALLPFIPFEYEQRLSTTITKKLPISTEYQQAENYLLKLANQLAVHMDLPAHYQLHITITDSAERNAFATLGGNIIITRGLIDFVESENALSMILGHEVAHIKNRDPLRSAGSRIFIQMIFTMIGGASDTSSLNSLTSLTDNTFSRKQENAADALALSAVQKHYGHTLGAEEFFEKIERLPFNIEFLSTHPNPDNRLQSIYASQNSSTGKVTPLPKILSDLKKAQ